MTTFRERKVRRKNVARKGEKKPDLGAAFEVVHPKIQEAARVASKKLTELGVRHVLVGGLGVSAYIADPRTTKDVDFLVGSEAWPTEGVIVSPIAGLPFEVGKVAVDTLLAPPEAPSLDEALARPLESEGIPVAPPEVLVAMKLIAGRSQDDVDVEKLLDVVDVDKVRAYVAEHAPDYVDDLDEMVKLKEAGDKQARRERNLARRLSRGE